MDWYDELIQLAERHPDVVNPDGSFNPHYIECVAATDDYEAGYALYQRDLAEQAT